MPELKRKPLSTEYYEKLGPRQKEFFDLYVKHRTLSAVQKKLDWTTRDTYKIFNSVTVQKALDEYNENIKTTSYYNEAVIIDELWKEYFIAKTSKDRTNILVLLGKAIGMWSNLTQTNKDGSKVTYNIVNYNNIKEEIDKNKEEVEKEKDKEINIPDGFEITNYDRTLQ